jgi:hypothetical protein
MRIAIRVFIVLVVLLSTPAVFAQVDTGVDALQGISDGCGDTMNPDDCMFSDSSTTILCTNDACPQCGFNQSMTASVCYRLWGAAGYCSCAPGGLYTDKYGQKQPNCATKGSCVLVRK